MPFSTSRAFPARAAECPRNIPGTGVKVPGTPPRGFAARGWVRPTSKAIRSVRRFVGSGLPTVCTSQRAAGYPFRAECISALRPGRATFDRRHRNSLPTRAWVKISAHRQLSGPIVPVRDNLNVHKAAGLREFTASRDRPAIYYLPSYAPDLKPVESSDPCCNVAGSSASPSAPPPNTSTSASDAA